MAKKSITDATALEQALTVAVAALKEGEVVSYGDIAARAGRPKAPRAAGALLSKATMDLPWWRVVRSNGALASGNAELQTQLLREESVEVRNGRVVDAPHGRFAKR